MDLASLRAVWRAPEETVAAMHRAFGRGWEVVAVDAPALSDGDGAAGTPEAARAARGAEVYIGWGVPAAVADAAQETLRWAHSAAAGVGASLTPAFRATGAALTNSRGVHAEPMADWAIAAIAFCARGFHHAVRAQRERRWAKDAFTDGSVPVIELADVRVGLVGLGGVGRAIAWRAAALGMEVRGVRRHPAARRPRGVRWVGGPNDLPGLAARSDVLVVAAPETAETRGLVDGPVLDALPAGAYVVNVARGGLVDEAALLARLDAGRVGGAALDVFATEPLPSAHPLWDHPRVFVTPHVSAVTRRFWDREAALILENIRRYRTGRRLTNLVDPRLGY